MPELDGVLTLSQRMLGVMKPRPLTTLHVGGAITADSGLAVTSGPVALPAGSVQKLLHAQFYNGTWSHPGAAGSWAATPLTYTGALSGGLVRLDVAICCTTAPAGYIHVAIYKDGASIMGSGPAVSVNGYMQVAFTYYDTSAPTGVHTYTVMVLFVTATSMTLVAGTAQWLYVTEQKA